MEDSEKKQSGKQPQEGELPPAEANNKDGNKPESTKNTNTTFIVFLCVLGGILLFGLIYGAFTHNISGVLGTIWSVALAILVLLAMITVHEFGHYIAGKIFGFGIVEFSLGFGPAIYKKQKKNGEIFSVRALPIGGYCAFEGEDDDCNSPTAFNNRKPWQRIIVLVAGATMNFLFALVLVILLFGIYGQSRLNAFEIEPNIQYSQSLESGDVILSLNGRNIYLQTDVISALDGLKEGDVIQAKVSRNGEIQTVNLTLRADAVPNNLTDLEGVSRSIGIAQLLCVDSVDSNSPFRPGDALFRECTSVYDNDVDDINGKYRAERRIYSATGLCEYLKGYSAGDEVMLWLFRGGDYYRLTFTLPEGEITPENVFEKLGINGIHGESRWSTSTVRLGFFATLGGSFVYAFNVAGTIFRILGELLTGKLFIKAMGGTVTTVVVTSRAIRVGGLSFLLEIAAYIGVNLAVFNLLPIPSLDGSRVVFTLIEMIFRKPVPKKLEGIIHAVGLIVLLSFAVLMDLLHLF